MIEIFLEAPIELQTLILGGVAALIVVLVKGNRERDEFDRKFKQDIMFMCPTCLRKLNNLRSTRNDL